MYTITDKITELLPIREIRETLRELEKLFMEKGYQVILEGTITGKSGEPQTLSVIAENPQYRFIIDISPWGKVENIITLLGKKMDLEPKEAILIDLSENNKLKQLEEIYKVKVESGKDNTYIEKIEEYIDSLIEPVEEKGSFISSVLGTRNNNLRDVVKIKEKEGAHM